MTETLAKKNFPSNLRVFSGPDSNEFTDALQYLLNRVSDGLMLIDQSGRITYANQALEQMVGCRSRDMLGLHFSEQRWNFQRFNSDSGMSVFQEVFDAGHNLADEVCRMAFDELGKKIFKVTSAVCHDELGKMAGIAVIVRDGADPEQIEEQDLEHKNVYERLADYADEAIFRVRVDNGQVTYVNAAAQKILGYSIDEYLSNPRLALKIINKEYVKNWANAAEELLSGKDVLKNVVIECTAKDGRTVVLEFTAVNNRDHQQNVLFFEAVGRDITVRRFMEAELAKAQKLESIGLLAGGIAHDFNNIMTAVFGSLSLAKMEADPDSLVYKRLAGAEEHCIKAKALTRKLLTYSRAGTPQRKIVPFAGIIRDAVGFALSGKNISCRLDIPDDLWSAKIDEDQMHQVVHALVSNAFEALTEKSVIEIGAQNVHLTTDQIKPLKGGCYIKWFVRDYGVGISQKHIGKIFDPYFTTKQMGNAKGTGLALAICYSIVKSHEGMITVASTQSGGTVFTVYIPAANGEGKGLESAALKKVQARGKKKILLIDDEDILLDVTGSMLEHLGYDVASAKSHDEALGYYRKGKENGSPFALIVMDLTMPGDDSGELAIKRWKELHPEVKAVISSGYMNDPVIEEFWEYGFVGAMVKPYSLAELKTSLEKILADQSN
jgi:PAS domain S-box-containing protein